MFPTVSDIIRYFTGINLPLPLQTFGAFMALGFVASYIIYKLEFKRKEREGWLLPILKKQTFFSPARTIHPYQLMDQILLWCGIFGLIGAFVFHKLEHVEDWISDPLHRFFTFEGLTWYGALIFGIATILVIAKQNKIKLIHVMDMGSPALTLGYAVGRVGCHLSGDGDWGITNLSPKPSMLKWLPNWAWAFRFPHNRVNEGIPINNCTGNYCSELEFPVFPTSFYEAVFCGMIFLFLWTIRKRIQRPGIMFGIYCVLTGTERILIEQLKANPSYNFLGMQVQQAEFISGIFILTGISVLLYYTWRPLHKPDIVR